jgi:hypothetical protein
MVDAGDAVSRYAASRGIAVLPRTVLVEGTTDEFIFRRAAALEQENSGISLLGGDLQISAAGRQDNGGASGVIRELVVLRGFASTDLLPNGRPRYRFIGLLDRDRAGQQAIQLAGYLDSSILEFKDLFRLHPVMPIPGMLDPKTVERAFQRSNAPYRAISWELEDAFPPSFIEAFAEECPAAIIRRFSAGDRTHFEFTHDGKAKFHRFIRDHGMHRDFEGTIEIVRSLRAYMNLPAI